MPPPTNPAPVSGPGQLAQRTDGGPAQALKQLSNAKYGEQSAFQQAQSGAPMASTPGPPNGVPPSEYPSNPHAAGVIPLSAPTQNPDEPVTSGAALGEGPGPEAMGIAPQQVEQRDMTSLASKYMPALEFLANMPNATPGSRLMVNLLKANT